MSNTLHESYLEMMIKLLSKESMYIIICDWSWKNQVPSTKNTLICIMTPIFCSVAMCYPKSVSFIEFLMDFYTYGDIFNTIWITDKKLLHFKLSTSDKNFACR